MQPLAPAKSASTTIAGVLAIILSSLWTLAGLAMLVAGAFITTADNEVDDQTGFDSLADAVGGALAAVGAVVLAVGILSLVVGVKVLQRRRWARVVGIVLFSLFAILGVLGAVGSDDGANDFDDGEESIAGPVAIAGSALLVVVLLALPTTARDIGAHEEARRGGAGQAGYGYVSPAGWSTPAVPPPGQWGSAPPAQQGQWGTAPPPQQGQWGTAPPPQQGQWGAPPPAQDQWGAPPPAPPPTAPQGWGPPPPPPPA